MRIFIDLPKYIQSDSEAKTHKLDHETKDKWAVHLDEIERSEYIDLECH